MDSLPPELLSHILLFLPRASYPAVRKTCAAFNAVLAPPLFAHLRGFLDLRAAEDRLARGANNPLLRPVTIWSPGSWPPPDMALSAHFLSALYSALAHRPWSTAGGAGELDGATFGALVGERDLTRDRLRRVQFLYEMYLEYADSDVFVLDVRSARTLEMMISYPVNLPKEVGVTTPFQDDDDDADERNAIGEVIREGIIMGAEDCIAK